MQKGHQNKNHFPSHKPKCRPKFEAHQGEARRAIQAMGKGVADSPACRAGARQSDRS